MKHFFALPVFLRVAIAARQFNVLEDLLAQPQYSVSISESYLTEPEATSILNGEVRTSLSSDLRAASDATSDSSDNAEELPPTYEELVLHGQRYLCSIPTIPPANVTDDAEQTKRDKEEATLELARATSRGWELLKPMKGNCIYFMSGWWSYSFCFNEGVKQFHQLPPGKTVPVWPPVEDKGVDSYMLGRYTKPGTKEPEKDDHVESEEEQSPLTEVGLETRGETRYLVQRLTDGTICDLTGKPRKIDIQFHCHPTSNDRIALIKELATCTYLMIIYTPRLCNDVAFMPPKASIPHKITCNPIISDEDVDIWQETVRRAEEALIASGGRTIPEDNADFEVTEGTGRPNARVGSVEIGARNLVPAGTMLRKSGVVGGKPLETFVATLASSANPDVKLSPAELKKLKIHDAAAVNKLRNDLVKLAGGRGWKLEVVDTVGGREVRGVIDDGRKEGEEEKKKEGGKGGKDMEGGGEKVKKEEVQGDEEGSEETYKEEL